MAPKNLQEVIDAAASPVELLRNSQIGSYIYPVVPADFQNWIKEQKAWRDTAVLYDQSHHMVNLFMRGSGRDQADLRHGDQLDRAVPGRQGQAVRADHRRRPRHRRRHPVPRGRGRVRLRRPRARRRTGCCSTARPAATEPRHRDRPPLALASDGQAGHPPLLPLPDPGAERVGGHREAQRRAARAAEVLQHVDDDHRRHAPSRTLRHGMAGAPGLEIWGPYDEQDRIWTAIVKAGAEFGLVPVGSRAYPSNTLESGWIPSPLPAIYTGERARLSRVAAAPTATRRPARSRGSFVSDEHRGLLPHALGARLRHRS